MDNRQLKSTETKSRYQAKDRKSLILGSVIASLLAISPYYFYLYESVPDTQTWDTFIFTYNSNYYESALTAAWTVTGKIVPLFFLTIWFFTCRHWWYHVLLIPITMYIFQLGNVLNDDLQYVDSFQFIYLIPVMAIVLPSIYLIRAKMFDRLNTATKSLEQLEEEFTVRPKTVWGKVKQYF